MRCTLPGLLGIMTQGCLDECSVRDNDVKYLIVAGRLAFVVRLRLYRTNNYS